MADALSSGGSDLSIVWVQLPPTAPFFFLGVLWIVNCWNGLNNGILLLLSHLVWEILFYRQKNMSSWMAQLKRG